MGLPNTRTAVIGNSSISPTRVFAVWRECTSRKAAGLVRRREHGQVITVARFYQLVEKPGCALGDGKCRRTEAAHRLSAHILQQFARGARVLAEFSTDDIW